MLPKGETLSKNYSRYLTLDVQGSLSPPIDIVVGGRFPLLKKLTATHFVGLIFRRRLLNHSTISSTDLGDAWILRRRFLKTYILWCHQRTLPMQHQLNTGESKVDCIHSAFY